MGNFFIAITGTGNLFYCSLLKNRHDGIVETINILVMYSTLTIVSLHSNTSLGITISRESVFVQLLYSHMSESHV